MARSALVAGLAAMTLALAVPSLAEEEDAIRARDDRIADLESKLETVVDELARLREQVAVPEEPQLKSAYGLGPAASKIYGIERGLSLGGYGEANYRNFIGHESESDRDRADFTRLVLYFGYKFSEKIVFNSEIEFEHALIGEETASSGSGEVGVEFATLDFFLRDEANVRAGLVLLPMGFINEVHEPPFYYGVERPETERRILPSTWREPGVGLFGELGESVTYRAYLVSGFNATGFDDGGIREGRQQGNRSLSEDFGFVARTDWTPETIPGLMLGGSFYFGDSGQDLEVDGADVPGARLWIGELHAQYRSGPLHLRGLFAYSRLSDAGDLNRVLGVARDEPIADTMLGGYAEVAYDVWPWLAGGDKRLEPFLRIEYVDTQYDVPSGFSPNRENAYWLYTPGINFYPHPNVVLKLEYRNFHTRAGGRPDELAVGIGFAF
jgi:hypothetical protein